MATDQKQTITWQWESTPYGVGQPEENGLMLNLRMPGQYYDRESSLFYNWNRYYDPSTGEYTRPDPLGERSDKQLYRYAGGSPVMTSDPMGLFRWLFVEWKVEEHKGWWNHYRWTYAVCEDLCGEELKDVPVSYEQWRPISVNTLEVPCNPPRKPPRL